MLEVISVSKSYNKKVKALGKVSLTIGKGDIFGFVGHNGAGKTTLLKSIAGIINIDEGDIIVNGISVLHDPLEVKKQIAYIPDNPFVYESLTGREYLDFVGAAFKLEPLRKEENIVKYTKLFNMSDVLKDPISSYSHGMKQKIILIGALIHEPKVFLLDEPFVGLDPKASYDLKQIFRKLTDEGACIFFSTHILEVVEKLCNQIAIIKKGHIVASGKTEDILKDKSLEDLFLSLSEGT